MRRLYYVIIILATFSCKSSYENRLKECVINETDALFEGRIQRDENYYEMILEIEELLIENHLLKNQSRNSYKSLVDKAFNNPEVIQNTLNEKSEKFDMYMMRVNSSILSVCFNCPIIARDSTMEKDLYNLIASRSKLTDELASVSYDNKQIFHDLIDSFTLEEFEQVGYRSQVMSPILIFTYFQSDVSHQ